MKEISKAEMLSYYEKALITDLVNTGDKIIARFTEGQDENPDLHTVIWCSI